MDKSNLYVTPPSGSYVLKKPFDMPSSNGTVWAIALSAQEGKYVNAALSVVYTLIFSWLWSLIATAVIYFAPYTFTRRRLVALVALRNASNPWSALEAFINFTAESMGCLRPKKHGQPSTLVDSLFGLVFVALILVVVIGSITMGIYGPPLLQIGNVAPVMASALYYPRAKDLDPNLFRQLRGDPSLRALSSVQVFQDALGPKVVSVVEVKDIVGSGDPDEPMYALTYGYDITGAELGLKHASDLKLHVEGACTTEYTWLQKSESPTYDKYFMFGKIDNTFGVNFNKTYITLMPKAAFSLNQNNEALNKQIDQGNISYAVGVTVAHRRSPTPGSDPWYLTELRPEEEIRDDLDNKFRIKRRRPALSCWHQDTWSCGGEAVTGVSNIRNLSRLAVPDVLKDVMIASLTYPPMQRLGEDAGVSALSSMVSSVRAKNGILNAELSSIKQDMKRLIQASYISTLNVFTDATRFTPSGDDKTGSNWFYEDGSLRAGADDFIVRTPDVQTFSLTGLIAVATIATFLLIIKIFLTLKLALHGNVYAGLPDAEEMDPNQEVSPFNQDRWARFKAFSAVHLLRNAYEDGTGVPQRDWKCSESLPEPREEKPLQLVRCSRGEYGCAGHLATAPQLLELELTPRTRRPRHTKVNSLSTLLGDGDISFQNPDGSSKKTQGDVTVTPFNGYSSSDSTPQHENVWSPDIQTGYSSYFPPNESGPYQTNTRNYDDEIHFTSSPPLQQPTNYYSGSRR